MELDILLLFLITFVVFLGVDMVWLIKIAPKFYRSQIGHLMADKPNLPAALIFYVVFILGLVFFVGYPTLVSGVWWEAMLKGAGFGLVTYATYDLTNMATLKKWPIKVTIIDLIWGTFLSTSTSVLVFFISGWLGI